MNTFESNWNDLKQFDFLATKRTVIHDLNPVAKLLAAVFFIVTVISFPKYDFIPLLPLFFYPVILINLADLPAGYLLKRLWFAAPFLICIAILNPLFDRNTVTIGPFILSAGWISFVAILLRIVLTVLAAFILVATSGLNEIGAALIAIKLPRIFVIQLLFIYRYLDVLLNETARMLRAHSLRSSRPTGLPMNVWGSFLGQLLLRTVNRAERIYQAMRCRGFNGEIRLLRSSGIRLKDLLYIFSWTGFFIMVRLYNLPQLLGSLLMGIGK